MKKWLFLLGGLVVWAAHFFLLYIFASLFPATDLARWLTLGATGAALTADIALIYSAISKEVAGKGDALDRWVARVGLAAALLSFISVLWQAFPALL